MKPFFAFKIYFILLASLTVLLTLPLSAQEFDIPQVAQKIVPPAPTAASLAKYGNVPVSNFTGIPNISIPLGQVDGLHLSVPVTLGYHGGGVKVDEMAGWTGLNWSLSAGGTITRTVRGLEDRSSGGFQNNPVLDDIDNGVLDLFAHPSHVEAMANGTMDGEVDIYHFNALGYSGKFIIDRDNIVRIIPYQDLLIEPLGQDGFLMTAPDGTRFTFDVVESTTSGSDTNGNASNGSCEGGSSAPSVTQRSAWHLSKIENANLTDAITFTYGNAHTYYYETGITATRYFDNYGGGPCAVTP